MSKAAKENRLKPFSGILAQPFDEPDHLIIALRSYREPEPDKKAINQAVNEYVAQQRRERLAALAEHYDVDLQKPGSIAELLYRLAADFVPGFRPKLDSRNPRGVGRPRLRSFQENSDLVASIIEIKHRSGVTALSACTVISKNRKSRWYGKKAPALYERYKRFNANMEILRKELDDHPLYARITEIKRARSPAT